MGALRIKRRFFWEREYPALPAPQVPVLPAPAAPAEPEPELPKTEPKFSGMYRDVSYGGCRGYIVNWVWDGSQWFYDVVEEGSSASIRGVPEEQLSRWVPPPPPPRRRAPQDPYNSPQQRQAREGPSSQPRSTYGLGGYDYDWWKR